MAVKQQQSFVLVVFVICRLIYTVGLTLQPAELLKLNFDGELTLDPSDISNVSGDFGGLTRSSSLAVLYPASVSDIVSLVRAAHDSASAMPVSARGHGHSINGQAAAENGVVIQMSDHHQLGGRSPWPKSKPVFSETYGEYYVDVWGGELWIDLLKWTLENGRLAPKSWTDYLYLSVGGTLSNAGISGQAFHHGPQISNVFELDVVTGKGELVTCSQEQNPELFHGVLGGLGQFGIITRARIALEPAPQRVRWIRVLYSNFTAFTRDQERLISFHSVPASQRFDYVEGFVIVDEGLINNWRSSFFSPNNPVKISSLSTGGGPLYCLEVTKNYDDSTAVTVDQDVEALLKTLDFIPGTVFTTDLPYVDFLDRVHKAELKLRAKGLWEVPHPWLNLFVPATRIADFNDAVFRGILKGNKTSGPILIYPMNKQKWDDRSSVVTPDEDVFYLVAFLRSAILDSNHPTQSLSHLTWQNTQILKYCKEAGIHIKQYLPHYDTRQEWKQHFGQKWERFLRRKAIFDPKHVLGSGQGIFRPLSSLLTS